MAIDVEPEERLLDSAEELFYEWGIQAVGMDEVREAAGLSLKRIYQLFPSKEDLVLAVLSRLSERWLAELGSLTADAAAAEGPEAAVLAAFDWVRLLAASPGFRGSAWTNAFAELGATSPAVAEAAASHQAGLRALLGRLVAAAGRRPSLADHLLLLVEGALATAALSGTATPGTQAKAAARTLLDAAPRRAGAPGGRRRH